MTEFKGTGVKARLCLGGTVCFGILGTNFPHSGFSPILGPRPRPASYMVTAEPTS